MGDGLFGTKLLIILYQRGYSQAAFARKVETSVQVIHRIVNNHCNPSFKLLQKILRELPDVDARSLIC